MQALSGNFQRISDDLELKAGAVVAHVLDAKLIRRDSPPAHNTRDFDLVLTNGSIEPLEVTRFVDRPALETWERLRKCSPLPAPSLARRWVLAVPIADHPRDGSRAPYDVQRFVREIEPALAAVEQAGYESIELGRFERDPRLQAAFATLIALGVDLGFSHPLAPGETASISFNAMAGGFTHGNMIAAAVEREGRKPDNLRKLSEPAGAMRRHLVVVFDGSSGSYFNAANLGYKSRLPDLPSPLTTTWVLAGGPVLVATPPHPWHAHEVPEEVFFTPERWLA